MNTNRNGRNAIFITRTSQANNLRAETDKTPGAIVRTSDYGYAHVWELQHLRGSPDYHSDVTKETNTEKAIPIEHMSHDHPSGTFPGCKNKDHMYESPQFQQTDDVIIGHEDGPFYHEFDAEIQDLNTFPLPSRIIHHDHDCIHLALSDKKL